MKENIPTLKFGMGGEVRMKLYDPDGSLAHDTGWDSNLILDQGLEICTTLGTWYNYWSIGDVGTAPTDGDTQMLGWLASSNTQVGGDISTNAGSPNYERAITRTKRFAAGVGTGTIAEFGVGASSDGTTLFSRHSVAVPFSKGINQVLDVSYRFTMWPPTIDAVNNGVVIGGETYKRM